MQIKMWNLRINRTKFLKVENKAEHLQIILKHSAVRTEWVKMAN